MNDLFGELVQCTHTHTHTHTHTYYTPIHPTLHTQRQNVNCKRFSGVTLTCQTVNKQHWTEFGTRLSMDKQSRSL